MAALLVPFFFPLMGWSLLGNDDNMLVYLVLIMRHSSDIVTCKTIQVKYVPSALTAAWCL